jgi:hypothetical protein
VKNHLANPASCKSNGRNSEGRREKLKGGQFEEILKVFNEATIRRNNMLEKCERGTEQNSANGK